MLVATLRRRRERGRGRRRRKHAECYDRSRIVTIRGTPPWPLGDLPGAPKVTHPKWCQKWTPKDAPQGSQNSKHTMWGQGIMYHVLTTLCLCQVTPQGFDHALTINCLLTALRILRGPSTLHVLLHLSLLSIVREAPVQTYLVWQSKPFADTVSRCPEQWQGESLEHHVTIGMDSVCRSFLIQKLSHLWIPYRCCTEYVKTCIKNGLP